MFIFFFPPTDSATPSTCNLQLHQRYPVVHRHPYAFFFFYSLFTYVIFGRHTHGAKGADHYYFGDARVLITVYHGINNNNIDRSQGITDDFRLGVEHFFLGSIRIPPATPKKKPIRSGPYESKKHREYGRGRGDFVLAPRATPIALDRIA